MPDATTDDYCFTGIKKLSESGTTTTSKWTFNMSATRILNFSKQKSH